jgi:hypothetical protein
MAKREPLGPTCVRDPVDANWTGHPTWGFSTEKPMGICCPKKKQLDDWIYWIYGERNIFCGMFIEFKPNKMCYHVLAWAGFINSQTLLRKPSMGRIKSCRSCSVIFFRSEDGELPFQE